MKQSDEFNLHSKKNHCLVLSRPSNDATYRHKTSLAAAAAPWRMLLGAPRNGSVYGGTYGCESCGKAFWLTFNSCLVAVFAVAGKVKYCFNKLVAGKTWLEYPNIIFLACHLSASCNWTVEREIKLGLSHLRWGFQIYCHHCFEICFRCWCIFEWFDEVNI